MSTRVVLLCALTLAMTGCWNERGRLALLAPGPSRGVELIGEDAVVGRACGRGNRESRAFDNAFKKAPGAQALTQVELADHGRCAVVIGRPARFAPGAAPLERAISTTVAHDGKRPPEGHALVYFYRADIGRMWRDATVRLGSLSPFELANGAVAQVTLPAGTYEGQVTRAGQRISFRNLALEAGRVYYVRITDTSTVQAGVMTNKIRSSIEVEIRDPAFARVDLRLLKD